jgi:putative PIN family toxin of toxin-antitoxin system
MRSVSADRPRAAIDTNVFVSGAIVERGIPYEILRAWRLTLFTLVVSRALRAELEEVLRRSKFSRWLTEEKIASLLQLVDATAERVTPRRRLALSVRDPKDTMLLAASLGGHADYLVCGDDDLLSLKGDPRLGGLVILTPREFLTILPTPGPVGN